jgi:hypothetical protein
VADFNSEGALLTMIHKITGKDSKYTEGQPVLTSLGGTLFDIATARILPPPLLNSVTDLVDPQMRRLSPSDSLGYDPGFSAGIVEKIPFLSKTLPPAGKVKTRALIPQKETPGPSVAMEVARLQGMGEKGAARVRLNDEGRPVWSYVDPDELAKVPRWRTMLRFAGMNVKPIPRDSYRRAVAGTEGSFQRMLRKTSQ